MGPNWSEWSRQAVRLMEERNAEWRQRFNLRDNPFRWDLGSGELLFVREADEVVANLCLVGTVSTSEGTFRWAWADEKVPRAATVGLDRVRRFGQEHDLARLGEAQWSGGRSEGLEMLAVAGRVLDADGLFVGDAGDVLLLFLLSRFRVRAKQSAS